MLVNERLHIMFRPSFRRSQHLPLIRLQEEKQQNQQKQQIHGKTQYLNLKAPSKNEKMQLDKTLTTQF